MFEFKMEKKNDVLVLDLTGEFDTAAAQKVQNTLQELNDKEIKKIVFDMNKVTLMASSGMRVMFFAKKMNDGSEIDVKGAKGIVQKVLKMSGIGRFVNVIQ